MNILFVSHLSTNIAAGPNWSVPAKVAAQCKYDNVLWINTTNVIMEHWTKVACFHNIQEYGELHLCNLPSPFSNPDVVVFEGFNFIEQVKFARELRKEKVPYIITPRGAMTYEAQHNHAWFKKLVARVLFQNTYVKHALAIQYLTEGERKSALRMFKTRNFVLPNGFSSPLRTKEKFHQDSIKSIFIGRLDMFHKGLDVLLDACQLIQGELREANFSLCIYGPRRYDYDLIQSTIFERGLQDFVNMGDEISGEAKEAVLLDSDLFILTSRFEGHPMGLIEALAYGVPAIVTPGSNMSQDIEEANAGWSCNELTIEEIVRILRQIILEQRLLIIKSHNAMKLSKRYDWDQLAKKFHDELGHL